MLLHAGLRFTCAVLFSGGNRRRDVNDVMSMSIAILKMYSNMLSSKTIIFPNRMCVNHNTVIELEQTKMGSF